MNSSAIPPVRLNVNAAIVSEEKILLIEFNDENGLHYNLPGGGLDPGESVLEGLKRECLEEACVDVDVEKLLMVWEYVPEKENFKYGNRQKLGLIFLCHPQNNSVAALPKQPDPNQTGVRWVPITELANLCPPNAPLFPTVGKQLREAIQSRNTMPLVWSEA